MSPRICHIAKATGISGSEKHLTILLPELAKAGWDVCFIMLVEPNNPVTEFVRRLEAGGIQVTRVVIRADIDPLLIWQLYRLFRREKYDLVHTHLIHADLYGTLAAKLARVPLVMSTKHNEDTFRYNSFLNFLNRTINGQVDHAIAISESLKRFTVEKEGVNQTKITRIYYGLNPDSLLQDKPDYSVRREFSIGVSDPLVGVIGRLTVQKGHRYLLEAFSKVVSAVPSAHLLVVGDGPLRRGSEDLAERLGMASRVIFTGWRDDVQRILRALDVVVMPSLWEGFGLVLLEAMAAAKPIVASRVGAIPEIVIDGETGLLVPPKDVKALAQGIVTLIHNPEMAYEFGERGRDRLARKFSTQKMVERTQQVYESLSGGR